MQCRGREKNHKTERQKTLLVFIGALQKASQQFWSDGLGIGTGAAAGARGGLEVISILKSGQCTSMTGARPSWILSEPGDLSGSGGELACLWEDEWRRRGDVIPVQHAGKRWNEKKTFLKFTMTCFPFSIQNWNFD